MRENIDFNLTKEPQWHRVINEMTNKFVDHVFDLREVEEGLTREVTYELKIVLGLFIANQLNKGYSREVSLKVVAYFFEDIFTLGSNSKYLRRELIELVSDRHERYIYGLKNKKQDDFLRSVSMHWFQFPLQKKNYYDVPFNYDFSKYFSDVAVVSQVLYDLAPSYAKAILKEIELEYISN